MEIELNGSLGREQRLKEAIESGVALSRYNYIIIVAATTVLIPTLADINSLNGIVHLGETIRSIRKYFNKSLELCGILFTRHTARTNISNLSVSSAEEIARSLDTKGFGVYIRQTINAPEAFLRRTNLISLNIRLLSESLKK